MKRMFNRKNGTKFVSVVMACVIAFALLVPIPVVVAQEAVVAEATGRSDVAGGPSEPTSRASLLYLLAGVTFVGGAVDCLTCWLLRKALAAGRLPGAGCTGGVPGTFRLL